ncbi:S-adenosyl-L-methionine-dependent methyltransferase [Calocera cornea HHB12733]|uniref:S-adenosyl-L-methionine-dependent methyltransferase n=1 Tax=Calocera cornea HHB12733 TaxID=1353952 RepID=A0A165I646_9BASI|nr:S-adenosyl-L-methionine-dependent methyltransferase [Calocera cornea HHB12733]
MEEQLQLKAAPGHDRYYTADTYLLPSDEEERVRLDIQHRVLTCHIPMLLPSGLTLKHGDAILDAGTGTGIWANAVAKMVPSSVTVYGIDIESRLFPPALPNTRFRICSTLDLPADWTCKFVYAHQRLMILAFTQDAWAKCISEFFRALKPGGWIRLEEYDCIRVFDGHREPSPLYGRFLKSLEALGEKRGIASDNLLKINGMLKHAGFEDVQFTKSMVLQCGEEARAAGMGAWRALKARFLSVGGLGLGATAEEYDRNMDEMEEELRGSITELMFVTWTAQKPV